MIFNTSFIIMNVYKCQYCGEIDTTNREFNKHTYLCDKCYNKECSKRTVTVKRKCIDCKENFNTTLVNMDRDKIRCPSCYRKFNRQQIMKKELEYHECNNENVPKSVDNNTFETLQTLNERLRNENSKLIVRLQKINDLEAENNKLLEEIKVIPTLKHQIEQLMNRIYSIDHSKDHVENIRLKQRIAELERINKEQKDVLDIYEFKNSMSRK